MFTLFYRPNQHHPWETIHKSDGPIDLIEMSRFARDRQTGELGVRKGLCPVSFWTTGHIKVRWEPGSRVRCKALLASEGWHLEQRNGRRQWVQKDARQLEFGPSLYTRPTED